MFDSALSSDIFQKTGYPFTGIPAHTSVQFSVTFLWARKKGDSRMISNISVVFFWAVRRSAVLSM
jgi:hypothetical protein